MMLLMRLAFRNIFRNPRRTLLIVTLISLGLAALMFTDGFILGMTNNMIESVTDTYLKSRRPFKSQKRWRPPCAQAPPSSPIRGG